MLALPALEAVDLNGRMLKVVATTSIIGDVVSQVGGDAIQLTVLIGPGQDSHSYEPATKDLTAAADADVIFVNGFNLEERLVGNLENIAEGKPMVPVSANIAPLEFTGSDEHADEHAAEGEEAATAGEEEHEHAPGSPDPHTWFSVHNVEQWVKNIQQVLSELDPANAGRYEGNATAYLAQLEELQNYAATQFASIPAERRVLVTNHDSFGYLANEYDFEILGTVIPSISTLAEPSANDLNDLIVAMEEHNVCVVFTETSVSDSLAQTVAAELENCDQVKVLPLYTEAIGPAGSGADSYVGMFRSNTDTIVQGLK
jgi:ABC-type Zn uptake system ZnuABC Zn-binding protein ZnuA